MSRNPVLTEFELRLADDFLDDTHGLYEFDWNLNSQAFNPDPEVRLALLLRLIETGIMDIYFSTWSQMSGALPLTLEDAISAVPNPHNWTPPTSIDAPLYAIWTNKMGEALIARSFTNNIFIPPKT
jgi:hypothetical protein